MNNSKPGTIISKIYIKYFKLIVTSNNTGN